MAVDNEALGLSRIRLPACTELADRFFHLFMVFCEKEYVLTCNLHALFHQRGMFHTRNKNFFFGLVFQEHPCVLNFKNANVIITETCHY